MEFTRSSNSSGHRSARGAFLLLAGWLALCGYACAGEDAFVFAEKVSAPPYDAITIAAPLRDTTVFDREGNVEVRIFLTPLPTCARATALSYGWMASASNAIWPGIS